MTQADGLRHNVTAFVMSNSGSLEKHLEDVKLYKENVSDWQHEVRGVLTSAGETAMLALSKADNVSSSVQMMQQDLDMSKVNY